MKTKSIYIYFTIIIVALITLILFSNNLSDENSVTKSLEPSSQSQGMINPSNENVKESFKLKLRELEDYLSSNDQDTAKMFEYAEMLLSSHNMDKAKEYYLKIVSKDNNRTDILAKLALIEFESNNLDMSKNYTAQIIAIEPSNTEAIYNLGLIEARIGDMEAAKKQWEDLLTNHPNSKMSDIAKESLERLSQNAQ